MERPIKFTQLSSFHSTKSICKLKRNVPSATYEMYLLWVVDMTTLCRFICQGSFVKQYIFGVTGTLSARNNWCHFSIPMNKNNFYCRPKLYSKAERIETFLENLVEYIARRVFAILPSKIIAVIWFCISPLFQFAVKSRYPEVMDALLFVSLLTKYIVILCVDL